MWRDRLSRSWFWPFALGWCACNAKPCQPEMTDMEPLSAVQVSFKADVEGEQIRVQYWVENNRDGAVLVLDRMSEYWSKRSSRIGRKGVLHPSRRMGRTGVLDPNWAYVELAGDTAIIKRHLIVDEGWTEEKEFPCGRELAPGSQLTDSFQLPHPVREHTIAANSKQEFTPFEIGRAEFHLGWILKPWFDPGDYGPERNGDDIVWPMTYSWVEGHQQITKSQRQKVDWQGLAYDE